MINGTSKSLPFFPQTTPFTCGAAVFASMYQFLRGENLGEQHFARELGTLSLGYTPVDRIVDLASSLGLEVSKLEAPSLQNLTELFHKPGVVLVTWWCEDAGHYSLVDSLSEGHVALMDPWIAGDRQLRVMSVIEFLPLWIQRGSIAIYFKN